MLTNYSEVNLGCKRRVASGLDWVFQTVEQAIILEDDCVPHPTFFRFCGELLAKYRDDERITTITGYNFQFGHKRTDYSYYFSRYCHVGGWATWRRAWQYYDVDMKIWPSIREGKWIQHILGHNRIATRWAKTFEARYNGELDTWDTQWLFASRIQSGLGIIPNVNLIHNIGFRPDGAHTTSDNHPLANLPAEAIEFPLYHPPFMIRNAQADNFSEKKLYTPTGIDLVKLAFAKAKRAIGSGRLRPHGRASKSTEELR